MPGEAAPKLPDPIQRCFLELRPEESPQLPQANRAAGSPDGGAEFGFECQGFPAVNFCHMRPHNSKSISGALKRRRGSAVEVKLVAGEAGAAEAHPLGAKSVMALMLGLIQGFCIIPARDDKRAYYIYVKKEADLSTIVSLAHFFVGRGLP